MANTEVYELACRRLTETDNAVLIEDEIHGKLWIPLSQVEEMHFDTKTHEGTIVMKAWIAKQKGLI